MKDERNKFPLLVDSILPTSYALPFFVFTGKFKEQATSNSAWLPVLNSKVPEPRKYSIDFELLFINLTFILLKVRAHVLMTQQVFLTQC